MYRLKDFSPGTAVLNIGPISDAKLSYIFQITISKIPFRLNLKNIFSFLIFSMLLFWFIYYLQGNLFKHFLFTYVSDNFHIYSKQCYFSKS